MRDLEFFLNLFNKIYDSVSIRGLVWVYDVIKKKCIKVQTNCFTTIKKNNNNNNHSYNIICYTKI